MSDLLQVNLSRIQIARIFSRVLVDRKTGCWNWIGFVSDGYGNTRYDGRLERVHRVIYAWAVESIPRITGRHGVRKHVPQLDHVVCQNRRCCNPAHLELVTPRVNILRGNGICARLSRQTHCPSGHLLPDKPNEKCGVGKTTRRCKPCRKERQHQAYLARKESGYYQ